MQDGNHRPEAALPFPGIIIFGQFDTPTGLATAARGTVAAASAAGMPFALGNLSNGRMSAPVGPWPAGGAAINLLHTNPDVIMPLLRTGRFPGTGLLKDRFTIGCWVYEAPGHFPLGWDQAVTLVDEIWSPSNFAAGAIAPQVAVPVIAMPLCIAPVPGPDSRADLGLDEDAFVFLFAFDGFSTERKNPQGLVRAFTRAFPVPQDRIRLVLKTRSLTDDRLRHWRQRLAVRPDIRIIHETWDDGRTQALIAACDCYVSLHRAEGFGMTLAEAMFFGKPVIATGYSGNLDFTNPHNSYLVPYRPARIERSLAALPAGAVWAEPDWSAAAALMRRVVDRPAEAAAIGAQAARDIRAQYSPAEVGRRIRTRIELLERSGRLRRARGG